MTGAVTIVGDTGVHIRALAFGAQGPERGFLRPRIAYAPSGGGTLRVSADMDVSGATLDLTGPCTLDVGTQTFQIPAFRRVGRRLWEYRSPDRSWLLTIRESRHGSSRWWFQLTMRGWSDTLPPMLGGEELHVGFAADSYHVSTDMICVAGMWRSGVEPCFNPVLAVETFSALRNGGRGDRIHLKAVFATDGVVPPVAPEFTVRVGDPAAPFTAAIKTPEYAAAPVPGGYAYTLRGPGHPSGLWRVTIDFATGRLTLLGRGLDLGVLPGTRGRVPVYLGGTSDFAPPVAIVFEAVSRGHRLSY